MPNGRQAIAGISEECLQGERIDASLVGDASAGWIVISAQRRIGIIDVRVIVKTDDDANILQSRGQIPVSVTPASALSGRPEGTFGPIAKDEDRD